MDVVIVAEDLPERAPDRAALLLADAPGGVQPVGYTPAELTAALGRGNPLAVEAVGEGLVLTGGETLQRLSSQPLGSDRSGPGPVAQPVFKTGEPA